MKKQFTLVIIFCFACLTGFSQSVTITPDSPRMVVKGPSSQQGLDLSTNDQYLNARVLQNSNSTLDKDMFLGYQSGTTSALHLFSNNTEVMTIKNGNVGIYNTNPSGLLHFDDGLRTRKIVLYDEGDNDNVFAGFGMNAGMMRYQVEKTTTSHVFFAGVDANSSNELMRIQGDGNVGIGTSAPHAPLQFSNGLSNRKLVLYEGNDNDHQFFGLGINGGILRYQINTTSDNHVFYAGVDATTSNELMRIQGNGKVSIGTDVNNNDNLKVYAPNYTTIKVESAGLTFAGLRMKNSSREYFIGLQGADSRWGIYDNTANAERFTLLANGNMGIGTATPDNKLDVLGTIRANEVIIESGWADYVFDEGFQLKSLTEVENYIKENKHLPDVPSAKEVQEKGAHVSDLMTKMMQKIEELTLYSIEQQKKIEALEKRLNEKK